MVRGTDQDQLHLLEHSASIATTPTTPEIYRYDDPHPGYELQDVETSDIGVQKGVMNSVNPPPYSSTWDEDPERARKGVNSFNE